jgi:hypothetical protein
MAQLLNDSVLIIGFLAIVLAPLTLVLDTGPGGAGWKLLTFLCCAFAAWFFIFPSNLLIALGMRDGLAHEPQSTACVKNREHRQAAGAAKSISNRPKKSGPASGTVKVDH